MKTSIYYLKELNQPKKLKDLIKPVLKLAKDRLNEKPIRP